MNFIDNPPGSLRERMKQQTRDLILDALVEALASGEFEGMAHDALAKRVGVSRQTVYRYFPDRESLLQALWERVNRALGSGVGMPEDEETLLAMMRDLYLGFDSNAALLTVSMSTPQGRAMRNSMKSVRQKSYRKATAAATADLPELDARMATAVLQLLNSGYAWLEMRQQWDLSGEEIATACEWAAKTLLADLRRRGGTPLDAS